MHPIGRVLRAHGLRGELHVQLFRPRRGKNLTRPESLALGFVYIGDERAALKRARWISPDNVVLTIAGIGDRDSAESKKGLLVEIDPSDAKTMPKVLADEADLLIGALAVDEETKRPLGTVASIEDNGAQAILVIANERGETMVPCVDVFIGATEVGEDGQRRVHIRMMPGLFEDDPAEPAPAAPVDEDKN